MVPDTAFRNSSLGNLLYKKVVPGTSKHWPYTYLLVLCLKFRLSPVCKYLNYYYDIAFDYWAIPETIQKGGVVG